MIQDYYQKAMKFAGVKHANQHVPGTDANYLLHISNVAMEVLVAYNNNPCFDVELAVQMAILHDTLEDADTSFEELKTEFGKDVAKGVAALTKSDTILDKTERMRDCLARINGLPKEVGLVKLADRITNLQKPPVHWPTEKCKSYLEEAKVILQELEACNEYLKKRLHKKISLYEINSNV